MMPRHLQTAPSGGQRAQYEVMPRKCPEPQRRGGQGFRAAHPSQSLVWCPIMVRGELAYGHDKYMYLPFPVLLTP
ncbi:hypothetical protein PoMZ_00030 [Pyricularia oryzae]|uniref:Uncharacterized protein n=1 Tax=Pyricularia oryzae TaxID=318829 RepID=A0A4P7MYM3_PYROR|nr:hypothetical protein PoMZ_00030 [Pyricularia oryzae]